MKIFFLSCFITCFCINLSAQDSDTTKLKKKSFENYLFSNDDTLTRNDYLLGLQKVYQLLNKASSLSAPVPAIMEMVQRMDEDDSAISIIQERLSNNDKALNVRNLQMFHILLAQIKSNTTAYAKELNKYDSTLDATKAQILALRKDTVIPRIFKDPALKESFKPELEVLAFKWKKADSIVKSTNILIDNTLAHTSDNIITTTELQIKNENLEATTSSRIFGKERRYLWEPVPRRLSQSFPAEAKKSLNAEKKITQYYFAHTHYELNILLLGGIIFFFWIFYNFRSLKKLGKTDALQPFSLQYMNSLPFFASLIFMLSIAPLFDLDAPAIYIEFIEFLLMAVFTFSFSKRLPKKLFYVWLAFIVLFLLSFSNHLGLPYYLQRWLSLIVSGLSFLLGIYIMWRSRKHFKQQKILFFAAALYTLLNLLAIICNLFGRVTLMQIFSSTATYAFVQTISLLVFTRSVTEAFILQIQSSRIRKEYPIYFEHNAVVTGISTMVIVCSVIIWLIVFATNLNVFDAISGAVISLLSQPRIVGSFSFTLGGAILFAAIMWVANFLQKYISYFFGDVGDDVSLDNNKPQRSRLLITRLILLIGGFLLAVAASGLPVDRITVILGALGVGIGLGLQSIVNNFVSGIILIFDRTLRIGDTVEIGDRKGRVKEISVRSSTLLTPDGAEVIIPNGDILSHNIVNWTLSNNDIRVELSFTIDKMLSADDIRPDVHDILKAYPQILAQKEPDIFINNITSQSTQLKIYFWCIDVSKTELARSEVYSSFYKKLEAKGIKVL